MSGTTGWMRLLDKTRRLGSPRLLSATVGWIVIGSVLVAAIGGCGGGGSEQAPSDTAPPAAQSPPSEAPPAATSPAASTPPAATSPAAAAPPAATTPTETAATPQTAPAEQPKPAAEGAQEPAAETTAAAEESLFPDDVSAWQEDDYLRAKRRRDPRLVDALAYLGESRAGDPQAVRLLTDLLQTPEEPEPEPQPVPKEQPKPRPQGMEGYPGMEGMPIGSGPGMEGMPIGSGPGGYEGDYSAEMYESEMMGPPEGMMESYDGYEGYPGGSGQAPEHPPLTLGYAGLTGAIVQALAANGTNEARQVMGQLLAGSLRAGSERAAVSAVIKALADYPCAENEAVLFVLLTDPQKLRPDEQAGITSGSLQETVTQLVERSASPALRAQVAAYVAGQTASPEMSARLAKSLTASHPYNVAAQIALYQRDETGAQLKQNFERYFTTYSASSLGRLLGADKPEPIGAEPLAMRGAAAAANRPFNAFGDDARLPSTTTPGGYSGSPPSGYPTGSGPEGYQDPSATEMMPPSDMSSPEMSGYAEGMMQGSGGPTQFGAADTVSEKAFQQTASKDATLSVTLAQHLWNPALVRFLTARLDKIESLQKDAQLVALASTVPQNAVRTQLYRTIKAHWKEGPQGLKAASKLPDRALFDPGYLLVSKFLSRQRPPVVVKQRRGDQPAQQGPEFAWLNNSYELSKMLCDRFSKVATAPVNQGDKKDPALASLPLELPPNANVVGVHTVNLLQEGGGKLKGLVDPLRVHYVRIEEVGKVATAARPYTRQLRSVEERPVKNGVWLDSLHIETDRPIQHSVDVFIVRQSADQPAQPMDAEGAYGSGPPAPKPAAAATAESGPIVIEILSIESTDFERPE